MEVDEVTSQQGCPYFSTESVTSASATGFLREGLARMTYRESDPETSNRSDWVSKASEMRSSEIASAESMLKTRSTDIAVGGSLLRDMSNAFCVGFSYWKVAESHAKSLRTWCSSSQGSFSSFKIADKVVLESTV